LAQHKYCKVVSQGGIREKSEISCRYYSDADINGDWPGGLWGHPYTHHNATNGDGCTGCYSDDRVGSTSNVDNRQPDSPNRHESGVGGSDSY
jgi:hypothetical protein